MVFDEDTKLMVPAIRYLYKPTLESFETALIPIYKLRQAAHVQDVQPVAQREALWDEEKKDEDEPAAKRPRLV